MILDVYPLSPVQQGMLFHALLDEGSGVDIQQLVVEFYEPLNAANFQRAWRCVIARHPILRTDFRWTHLEQPVQQVHATLELPWREEDWRGLALVDREERLDDFLRADRCNGMDLARAPLFRLTLFHFDNCDRRFVWTVHHALLDGRSITTVMGEVFMFYEALGRGEEAMLPAPRPYRDYVEWLCAQDFGKSEPFWRRALNGLSSQPLLFGDGVANADAATESHGRHPEVLLALEVTSALRRLARQNQLTLNTVIQGAWAVLLSRYSDQSDVVFGVVRACRSAIAGAEAMVGLFSSTLPLRTRVDPDSSLLPWLAGLQAQWKAMRNHEHTPLGKVREWSEVPPGGLLFESIIMFEKFQLNTALQSQEGPGRKFTLLGQSIYPINLLVYDGAELRLEIVSGRGRPNRAGAGQMLQHLKTLLEAIAADPKRKIRELPLLASKERDKLLRDWNGTAAAYTADICLHELFERQVEWTPQAIALIFNHERLTYRELNSRANQLAHHLRMVGIGPGSLVGIYTERSIHLVVALLGVLKAGAAYLPMDSTYPADRIAFMLNDASVNVVLCQRNLSRKLPCSGLKVFFLDNPEWATSTPTIANPSRIATDANLAYVMYTSGSTGAPKGVMISHRAIVNNILWMRSTFPMDERDRVLQKTEISFDPSVWEFFLPLAVGAQLVIPRASESQNPDDLLQLIIEHHITILNCIPSFLSMLLENPKFETCGSLRHCFCGGEVMCDELVKRFYSTQTAALHNMYGPTEAAITSLFYSVPREGFSGVIPIGRPVANTLAYVLDRHREPVPVGVAGELYVGGAQLADGYYNRPELTAERFPRGCGSGFENALLFRTGDKVRWRSDGNIEFLGRIDQQVKFRGYRIELGEIEAAISSDPRVRDCVVVLHNDNTGRARLIAYVAGTCISADLVDELRKNLKKKLPAYMVPNRILILDALPTAPNGKVDRQALPLLDGREREVNSYYPPRSPIEKTLASLWKKVLQCEDVGIRDDFFEMGGHSLSAVRLVSAINRTLQLNVRLADIFAMRTIEELANAITSIPREGRGNTTVVKLHDGTSDRAIYCIGLELFRLAKLVGGSHSMFGVNSPWPVAWSDVLKENEISSWPKMEQLVEPVVSTLVAQVRLSPCVLVGYSFAGLMAFEIAHQLRKRGGKVDLVILLDTRAKHGNAYQAAWHKWRRKWKNRVSTRQLLQTLTAAAIKRATFKVHSRRLDDDGVELSWQLKEKLFSRIQRCYQPRRIESRGLLFVAQEADTRAAQGWGGLFGQGLEIISVPGDHYSMLAEPHIERLVSEMKTVFRRDFENAA
jgi:amino acid adenylation domain-containing protein